VQICDYGSGGWCACSAVEWDCNPPECPKSLCSQTPPTTCSNEGLDCGCGLEYGWHCTAGHWQSDFVHADLSLPPVDLSTSD
jgi:hypothetical protein